VYYRIWCSALVVLAVFVWSWVAICLHCVNVPVRYCVCICVCVCVCVCVSTFVVRYFLFYFVLFFGLYMKLSEKYF